MNTSELGQPCHLGRRGMIYIRQSSASQVTGNLESQKMQYALRDRAVSLGWHPNDIHVIDADLGRSGASTEGRAGFQELVAEIALEKVGILIAFDATRLARNCTHWYQLLDLCGRTDCLIADRDGVYDPTSINDRLLLGLKGQISELELHTIRARLTAGILSKAQRGELELVLPTGLERLTPWHRCQARKCRGSTEDRTDLHDVTGKKIGFANRSLVLKSRLALAATQQRWHSIHLQSS